jgi:hypothetical protein
MNEPSLEQLRAIVGKELNETTGEIADRGRYLLAQAVAESRFPAPPEIVDKAKYVVREAEHTTRAARNGNN